MGGQTPTTFAQGFLSGLAHPVIGLDHLVFLLLAGAYTGFIRSQVPLVMFVAASAAGCLVHVYGVDLPRSELILAGTLLATGAAACAALRVSTLITSLTLAACGLLHGYAYGESIVGSESAALAAYLLGFGCVQLAISITVSVLASRSAALKSGPATAAVRGLGMLTITAGAILFLQ